MLLLGASAAVSACGLTSTVDEIPLNEARLADGAGSAVIFEEIIANDDGKIAFALAPDLWKVSTDGVGVDIDLIPGGGVELETTMEIEAICVGFCDRQDWADYMYTDAFSPFAVSADDTVLSDLPLAQPAG